MRDSLIPSFLVSDVSESLRSLTKMSNHERFAQVAHWKWETMSKSLRSLNKNEQMSESHVFLSESLIRSFFRKNERFAQKTDERIPSPANNWTIFVILVQFTLIYKIYLNIIV